MRGLRLGIVGSEAAKFTPETERAARDAICGLIHEFKPHVVVSGACPLGGIDIWATEEATQLGISVVEFPPQVEEWDPPDVIGYKARNLQIANHSDVVVCITLKTLPPEFTGRTHPHCYHHKMEGSGAPIEPHVKSGGCWTMAQAEKRGKMTRLVVIG